MWYWYIFEDGYRVCVMEMSRQELAVEVRKHGALVKKVRD